MRHRVMSGRSSRRYTPVTPNWTLIATVFAWALAAWVPLPLLAFLAHFLYCSGFPVPQHSDLAARPRRGRS